MPKVLVTCSREWLQDMMEPEGSIAARFRHHLMRELIGEILPSAVADAVNAVDDTALTVKDIIVIPLRYHPAVYNASDFEVDVQPGNGRAWWPWSRRNRRRAIRESVRLSVQMFLDRELRGGEQKYGVTSVKFDCECRPLDSSGGTYEVVADRGEMNVIATWD